MWQQCPVCKGTGINPHTQIGNFNTCPTCKGLRIISELTGLPPIRGIDPFPIEETPSSDPKKCLHPEMGTLGGKDICKACGHVF